MGNPHCGDFPLVSLLPYLYHAGMTQATELKIAIRPVKLDRSDVQRALPRIMQALKEEMGCSWSEFSLLLGIERSEVCRWRRGNYAPSIVGLYRIIMLASQVPGGLDIVLSVEDPPDLPVQLEHTNGKKDPELPAEEEARPQRLRRLSKGGNFSHPLGRLKFQMRLGD